MILFIGTSFGTVTNTEKCFQLRLAPSGVIQIHITGSNAKKIELPNDLDLLGEIYLYICYIGANRYFKF